MKIQTTPMRLGELRIMNNYFDINRLNFDVSKNKDKFYYDTNRHKFYYFAEILDESFGNTKFGMIELHCTEAQLTDYVLDLDKTKTEFIYKSMLVHLFKCYSISNKYTVMKYQQFRSLIKYSNLDNFVLYFER